MLGFGSQYRRFTELLQRLERRFGEGTPSRSAMFTMPPPRPMWRAAILRATVFSHVQRMPVAFFTRTRTGALVSRLNNDVIGAQRAFSDTLSGVVGNTVTLTLTLVVMLTLSWQVTLLSLVLLPVFVLPARRMGRRLARLGVLPVADAGPGR